MLPMKRQDKQSYPGKAEYSRINVPVPYVWLGFAVGVPLVIVLNAAVTGSAVKIAGAVLNAMFWGFVLGIITYVKFTVKTTEYRDTVVEITSIRHEPGAWVVGMYAPVFDQIIYATMPTVGAKIKQGKKIPVVVEVEKRKYLDKVEKVRFYSLKDTQDITEG